MLSALDYLIDAKEPLSDLQTEWGLFISAYNDSARVRETFERVPAVRKIWWVLPEYGYSTSETTHLGSAILLNHDNEADLVVAGLSESRFQNVDQGGIRIDITGFMRPQILYLMAYLKAAGVCQFDFLYTEPRQYSRRAETEFALGEEVRVRSVAGYIGSHSPEMGGDVLILGVGYDHPLISHTVQAKESARIIQLQSLPSLSADMYQESILRLDRALSVPTKRPGDDLFFSSANDPFVTAAELSDTVSVLKGQGGITNLYLSPLATKPQAVGFGLLYLRELMSTASSIIFPFSARYSRETSTGVGRSWVYHIVL